MNAVSIELGGLGAGAIVFGIPAVIVIADGASRGGGVFTGIAGIVIALPFALYYQLNHQVRLLQFIAKKMEKKRDI